MSVLVLCTDLEAAEPDDYPDLMRLFAAHRGPATIEVLDHDSATVELHPGTTGDVKVVAVLPPEKRRVSDE